MKLKRLVAMCLATIMTVGLVACGPQEDKKPSGNNQSGGNSSQSQNVGEGKSWEEVLAEIPAELTGTSITVYNWNPMSEYPGAAAVIEEFTRQTGIEVNWQTEAYDTYLSKLSSMVASGEAPDVVRLHSPSPAYCLSLQPISVTGYDFTDAAWDQWVTESYTIKGEAYGVRLKNTLLASPNMLLYNKSLIEKYDLDDPYTLWKRGQWTYDKFVEIMKMFKDEAGVDFACSIRDYGQLTDIFGQVGPIIFDGEKYVNNLSNADLISATQKVADLMNTDHLLKVWAPDEFDKGQCLFWCGQAVYARRQNAYLTKQKEAGNVKAVPLPTVDGKESGYTKHGELEAFGIPKGAKNAEAVPYFIRFFQDRMNYDEEAFFSNTQVLEVYDYLMNAEQQKWNTGSFDSVNQFTGEQADEFTTQIQKAPGSQVISIFDSTSPAIDQRVKRLNEQLEQMGK